MQTVQEVYSVVRGLPSDDQLQLAALILGELALDKARQKTRTAKAQRRERDIEIINQNLERLNAEALDALCDQVEL